MDINNVFVIIGRDVTKLDVINVIKDEGYQHNFFFDDGYDWETIKGSMKISDEVWIFGDVIKDRNYKYALDNDMDIWNMTS